VVARIVEDGPKTDEGMFTRRMEIVLIPDGLINQTLAGYESLPVHKVLAGLLERGLVT
jgi:hypothetical protein